MKNKKPMKSFLFLFPTSMRQFFRSYIRKHATYTSVRHAVSLGEVTHGCSHFTVWSAILGHNDLCNFGIWCCDIDRVLQSFFIIPHYLHPPSHGHGSVAQFQ